MTSLSYLTENIKLLGKWTAIAIAGIIVIIFLFRFLVFMKDTLFPTPLPPPSVTWGKLPQISFPQSQYNQQFSYSINTLSGSLPSFPDRMIVNLIATPTASLQSLNNAKHLVQAVGFDGDEVRISESVYQWLNPNPPEQKMQYDIISKNFMLTSNYLLDEDIIKLNQLPDEQDSQRQAEDFLTQLQAFPSDIQATKSAITFFAVQDGSLAKTTSFSNAQIIRVDFFQQDVNSYPIYYPQYPYSPLYVLIGGTGDIVEATYNHNSITDTSGTYPIYSATEALEQLKKGQGYIAYYEGSSDKILIQNVRLGYYLDDHQLTYLMPIYIFEGNDKFTAYVSAIKGTLIQN